MVALSNQKRDSLQDYFKNLHFVLIDEVSMITSDQLYQVHCRLSELKQNNREFANVSVIVFGDLLQLRPVNGKYVFESPRNEKYKKVSQVLNLWEKFEVVDLEFNHRQGEDKIYADLLNRLRYKSKSDELSDEDCQLLNSRIVEPTYPDNATKIFGKNVNVNAENLYQLNKLDTPLHTIQAVHLPNNRNVKINADGTVESTNYLDIFYVKKGSRVMLIDNIDTSDGLVNGAQGTVQEILTQEGKVHYILIKFDNEKVGQKQRRKLKFLENITEIGQAVPIEQINFNYSLGSKSKSHGARASLLQMPLKLAWSFTSHKVCI